MVTGLLLLLAGALGAPQERVVFLSAGGKGAGVGSCKRQEIFWAEDGKCYTPGQKGPCGEGKVVGIVRGKPGCRDGKERGEEGRDVQEKCTGDKVSYEGGCWQLASTGPCGPGQWLVLEGVEEGEVLLQCRERRCGQQEVWWPGTCSCLARDEKTRSGGVCGEGGEVMVTPYGEGVCGCKEGWEVGVDHGSSGGQQGVCRSSPDWHSGIETRGIFDNIPVNDETAFSRATRLNCYVDDAGNCRRSWELAPKNVPRFANTPSKDESSKLSTAQDLIEWLTTFEKQELVEDCPVRQRDVQEECVGDKVSYEGGCWQLASTGPCGPGQWLVLEGVEEGEVLLQCRERRCGQQEVWWPGTCSCLARDEKTRSGGVCGEGGEVMVTPYGEGVCGCKEGWEVGVDHGSSGGQQGVCRSSPDWHSGIETRGIFDNIPVNDETAFSRATRLNCYVDDAGNCRRSWGLAPKNVPRFADSHAKDESSKPSTAQDLIEWLKAFEKNELEDECPAEESS